MSSNFIPGNSCVAQLLSITHEIYKSFDCNPLVEIKGTFLDISKAFDKFEIKLKSYGMWDNFLELVENHLKDPKKDFF